MREIEKWRVVWSGGSDCMEAIIADASAFQFLRTPPIVQLFAAGPDDHPALLRLVSESQLVDLRAQLLTTLPLNRVCVDKTACWKTAGETSRALRSAHPLLAVSSDGPIDVVVNRLSVPHSSEIVRSRRWTAEIPPGETLPITDDIRITSPAFTLYQLASHLPLMRVVLLASELCGQFSVYMPPTPIASLLERLHREGYNLRVDGWSPGFQQNGRLSGTWQHEPYTDPGELIALANKSDAPRGRGRLIEAAGLVNPNAASPFEVRAGLLLGLSRKRGGEGYKGLVHNEKVVLTRDARLLAQRECCYCDIFFSQGLDIECQSRVHHDNARSFLSDSDRSAALDAMGITVYQATYPQIKERGRFEVLSRTVAGHLGVPYKAKTAWMKEAECKLRNELFVPWEELPFA